ncbi:cyclic nucleotide-binding domain-containing protein [Sulfuriflexus mobilis]|uniref:cyclic nucleotide-binding domain-containing protein n=1 Tax=Sulfuriflexus mobilis TaxID=1811807 RepID=UPI001559DEFD|nr:cyclic nucleotide-binding domain-containing protein [Sulfuriflexus mobilis]
MNSSDRRALAALVPINALTHENFEELARKARIEQIKAGRILFKAGENDKHAVYVLAGEVELSDGSETSTVKGGSQGARHPLSPQQPRTQTARAKTDCTIALVDRDLLDVLLTWDQSSSYQVEEVEESDGDWMSRLLHTPSIMQLPAANIQALFMKLEQLPVEAGEVVIRQGGEGDYYYIISEGRCQVTRISPRTKEEMVLAELNSGDAFGEEALISENKRNATITMLTDGVLMRLGKSDFIELMKEPLHSKLSYEAAAERVAGGAVWLDVRLPSEHSNGSLPGSINLPLFFLRKKADEINAERTYIMVCDTGRRSASAAYLLAERGFDVYVLEGGLNAVPSEASAA